MATIFSVHERAWPAFAAWIKQGLPKVVENKGVWKAFKQVTGLSEAKAKRVVAEFGTPPLIEVRALDDFKGMFDPAESDRVVLSMLLVEKLQQAPNKTDVVVEIERTLLHELVHWALDEQGVKEIDPVSKTPKEMGWEFERLAYDEKCLGCSRTEPNSEASHHASPPATSGDASAMAALRERFALPTLTGFETYAPEPFRASAGVPGLVNNNPGNVEYSPSNPWVGQAGSRGRFSVFLTPEAGLRAAAITLANYKAIYAADTLWKIFHKWAPFGDGSNDPRIYARFVAKASGLPVDQALDLWNDDKSLLRILPAIIQQENGQNPYREQTIRFAIEWAMQRKPR